MPNVTYRTSIMVFALATLLGGCTQEGLSGWSPANGDQYKVTTSSDTRTVHMPALVVSDDPLPEVIYRRGSRDAVLASDATPVETRYPLSRSGSVETLVTRKVADLSRDLTQLENETQGYQARLQSLQSRSDAVASEYYALVASINTELQSGTTPGNPVLTERWNVSQDKLNALAQGAGDLNMLAGDLAAEASRAAYLQETVRATYGLSGAVEEDHRKLQVIEDSVNQNIVGINRLLTAVNDEIKRRDSYLRSERLNMQTMALSIANGELYGKSLTNSLFRKATENGADLYGGAVPAPASAPANRRPLVVIRFDRANVDYEQPVYGAISQALQKYPAAKFELVAVSPSEGNPAELALASTEARKNGEDVLRSMTQMGLPLERISLSAANSPEVRNSEVRIYIQ